MRLLILFLLLALSIPANAQPHALRISDDGRRIIQVDGSPFVWLGDTAWELFHRLDRDEADHYLEDRARKGFNVIQAVVLAELDGLNVPNPYGEIPLINQDPTKPNEAYFLHVDYIVDKAEALGMYVGMLPTWGDKWNMKWGVGPVVFTPENARIYGEYIGHRYRDEPIVWLLGGDRGPEAPEHLAIIRAMAQGIEQGTGGTQLITFHPFGSNASYLWFHDDPWLDFNMFQSGHSVRDVDNYTFTAEGYARTPVKPIIDGEPPYEDHPVNWRPEEGWFGEFDVRQSAYWSMLSGAAGHTYGNHNIWQMWQPGRQPISSARTPWRVALQHPGATQMGYMRRLFESRPFLELVPDQSLITTENGEGPAHIRAARSEHGRYLIAYTPYGSAINLDLEKLSGAEAQAWWFNPRTEQATEIGAFPSSGVKSFDPPGSEQRGNDWVLVIDDAAATYPAPGTASH